MNKNISVIQVEVTSKPTASGGKYEQAEVTYKDMASSKVDSKKLMSFVFPEVFATFKAAKAGDSFCVSTEKNEKSGYWDWVGVSTNIQGNQEKPSPSQGGVSTPNKSNYETPEERAKKQVYIVKQFSLSGAISMLSVGAKAPPSKEAVLALAQEFVDFVFDTTSKTNTGFDDMDDDIPF
jgi:hypothetical protein